MKGKFVTGMIGAAVAAMMSLSAPAQATEVTFATFSALDTTYNVRLENSGNSAGRTEDAKIFTTSTGASNVPGSVNVRFSFLQPYISTYVTDVVASFTLSGTIAKNTPLLTIGSLFDQPGLSGTMTFLSTTAITVGGPHFIPHTYAAGSNLLTVTFGGADIIGTGGPAGTLTGSTFSTGSVTYTSDFLDFSTVLDRGLGVTMTSATIPLQAGTGANKALQTFRATAGGQFSSNPAPLINNAVPEPATWVMMIFGFCAIGLGLRRRPRSVPAHA